VLCTRRVCMLASEHPPTLPHIHTCLVRLDLEVPAHNALVRWWIHTNAESQWPATENRRAAVATSGSTMFRRMATLYRGCLRCGDLRWPLARSHEAAQRSTRTLGLGPKMSSSTRPFPSPSPHFPCPPYHSTLPCTPPFLLPLPFHFTFPSQLLSPLPHFPISLPFPVPSLS